MFPLVDDLRRAQGRLLGRAGFEPIQCSHRVLASGRLWRLRAYDGPDTGPCVVIVSTPIKRPYIWDLAPAVSAIRYCLHHRLRVFLIEWRPPGPDDAGAGLDEYVGQAIGEAVSCVSKHANGERRFLMGHSLGGTFAAIFAALAPTRINGLVLLGAPLSFHAGVSRFRDALVALTPPRLAQNSVIPGTFLSVLSAMASPETFIWSRLIDAGLSISDPLASDIQARIERWTLDEVPLSGALVGQILKWLYRENRFCREALTIRQRTVGPSSLQLPMLVVVNPTDEIAPNASVTPVLDALTHRKAQLILYPGEIGIGFPHLGILVGRRAYATVWPQIVSWLTNHGSFQAKRSQTHASSRGSAPSRHRTGGVRAN